MKTTPYTTLDNENSNFGDHPKDYISASHLLKCVIEIIFNLASAKFGVIQ